MYIHISELNNSYIWSKIHLCKDLNDSLYFYVVASKVEYYFLYFSSVPIMGLNNMTV